MKQVRKLKTTDTGNHIDKLQVAQDLSYDTTHNISVDDGLEHRLSPVISFFISLSVIIYQLLYTNCASNALEHNSVKAIKSIQWLFGDKITHFEES